MIFDLLTFFDFILLLKTFHSALLSQLVFLLCVLSAAAKLAAVCRVLHSLDMQSCLVGHFSTTA